jgi:hypothetical protein
VASFILRDPLEVAVCFMEMGSDGAIRTFLGVESSMDFPSVLDPRPRAEPLPGLTARQEQCQTLLQVSNGSWRTIARLMCSSTHPTIGADKHPRPALHSVIECGTSSGGAPWM